MYPNPKDYVIHMIHMAFRPEGHVLRPRYKRSIELINVVVAADM